MSLQRYDLILVTGCSHSCGMEMNDHLLPPADNLQMRQASILKWGRTNLQIESNDLDTIKALSEREWETRERQKSWPSMLEQKTGTRVVNLAMVGASFGRSLLSFSDFLRNRWTKERTAVIHQVPATGRMCLRFDNKHGRVNVVPGSVDNFGYANDFFKQEIQNVHRQYKKIITSKSYINKYNSRLLQRFDKLTSDNQIDQYFIINNDFNAHLDKQKIIIDDFVAFRKKYDSGKFGHPIGNQFNSDISDLVIQTLS